MKTSPRSSVLIDLAAVRHNVAHLLALLAPGSRMLVAVKADGYGHGTLPVAHAAVAAGADGVAVATAEEAVALRDAGFDDTILVMGPLYSFDQYEEMARQRVDFAVVSDHMAAVLPTPARHGPEGPRAPQDRQRHEPPGTLPLPRSARFLTPSGASPRSTWWA